MSCARAACVLPELVGPRCATTRRLIWRAAGYQDAGQVRSVRCAGVSARPAASSTSGGGEAASSRACAGGAGLMTPREQLRHDLCSRLEHQNVSGLLHVRFDDAASAGAPAMMQGCKWASAVTH